MENPVQEQRQNRIWLGAACMCLAMFGGASIDVSVKALAPDYSTAQIVLLRSVFALPVVIAVLVQQKEIAGLRTAGAGWQLWRGLLTAGANFGFFYGLIYVELVTALMLAYIGPVLIVLLAWPLLGERVSLPRMLGVLIGFSGVVFVIQPDGFDLQPGILAILGSALCWSLLSISNRQLSTRVSTPVLTFYTYPVSLLLAAILTIDNWVAPAGWDWGLFAVAGLGSVFAHGFAAAAYKYAPAGAVAPFEYTALIWITSAGFIFWGEVPAWTVWLGGAAVIIGGAIALHSRE